MEMTRKDVYLGTGAIIVIVVCTYLLYTDGQFVKMESEDTALVEEVPAMTALMKEVLEKSTGFQLLVSYTDGGFQPSHASIKRGDTVRFTNNSSGEVWVSAAAVHNGNIFPGGPSSCGQSAFDSCTALQPKEFWEFTFDESGTWGYINVANPTHDAALEVVAL